MSSKDTCPTRKKLITATSFIIVACSVFYFMGQWLIPFLVALILAYALHVPSKKISQILHVSIAVASGIIILLLVAAISVFTTFLVPLAKNATFVLIQKLPILLQTLPDSINELLHNMAQICGIERTFDIGSEFKRYLSEITSNIPSYVPHFIDTGKTLMYIIMFVFMTPMIAFYLLKDWSKIEISFKMLLQKIAPESVGNLIQILNTKLAAYVKGQLLICCILSIIYTATLFFIGADQYVFCGIFSGALSIAPFFGPFLGLLTTLAMALDEFSYTYQYVSTICLYVIVPFIDSNFFTPKLIGRLTGIQPVWLLFSLGATISILGFAGIFIAVPTAVVLSTICKEITKKI
jgi:predicted PurR-regulated permease PerM